MNGFRLASRLILLGVVLASCASAGRDDKPAPTPTREVVSGAARLRGGGFRMDVQVGRGLPSRPGQAGATVIAPHATVTP